MPIVRDMDSIAGSLSIRHTGLIGFPRSVLVSNDLPEDINIIAKLGRDGWFRTFYGRGRKVELNDGTSWRITGAASAGSVVPVVKSKSGKLAIAEAHGQRCYAIDGPDYTYNLYPLGTRGSHKNAWSLRNRDTEIAYLKARTITAHEPIPLPALLLCFTLVKYGVLGEHDLGVPEFHW